MANAELSRRSFLSLIAAALSVEPARLVARAMPPRPDARAEPKWFEYPYTAWDTLIVKPNMALSEETFFPPLPDGLSIRGIRWIVDAEQPYADLKKLLGDDLATATLSVRTDELELGRGPLAAFGYAGLGVGSAAWGMPVFPEVRPKDNFNVRLGVPALELTKPVNVTIAIDGVVRVYV